MVILRLAEPFKAMNPLNATRPDPIRSWRFFTVYFSEIIEDKDMKIWHFLDSSLQFKLPKFAIDIFDSSKTMRFSAL